MGSFKGWSQASIIHHKAAGSPQATSDHCSMRLIRKRECFPSSTNMCDETAASSSSATTEVCCSREVHVQNTHARVSHMPRKRSGPDLNCTPFPLPTAAWFIPAPLYPRCKVFLLPPTLSPAVQSLR